MSSIWEVLSAIDCKEHIELKGKFSYLAWTWAWAMVKEKYPEAEYFLDEDITYPDRIDSGFRAMIDYGVSDEFITSAFAVPLLEGGPSRIISSNFCNL